MTTRNIPGSILALLLVLAVGACQNMGPAPYTSNTSNTSNREVTRSRDTRPMYGVVKSIEVVRQETQGIGGSTIGLGTIAGAVIGGVVGNQIGSGTGNTVATVAGAAGGAYVGHEIQQAQQEDAYKITLRLEDGSYQTLFQSTNSGFRVGDRVRLDNGVLQRY